MLPDRKLPNCSSSDMTAQFVANICGKHKLLVASGQQRSRRRYCCTRQNSYKNNKRMPKLWLARWILRNLNSPQIVAVNSGSNNNNDSAGHAKFEIYNNIAFVQYFDNDRVIALNPSIKSAITSDLPLPPPSPSPPRILATPLLINAQI